MTGESLSSILLRIGRTGALVAVLGGLLYTAVSWIGGGGAEQHGQDDGGNQTHGTLSGVLWKQNPRKD